MRKLGGNSKNDQRTSDDEIVEDCPTQKFTVCSRKLQTCPLIQRYFFLILSLLVSHCSDFFPRDAMQVQPMPSCRLSRSYILSKRINISLPQKSVEFPS